LKACHEAGQRIVDQQYTSTKTNEELVKAAQSTAQQLVVQFAKEVAAADADRDRRLRAVAAEERERIRMPTKGDLETEGEYHAKLLKRAVEESRRVADMTLRAADVQTIAIATSPEVIPDIVEDAIKSAPTEAVKRIGRAAELRAAVLAADEARDGGTQGAAFQAHLKIQDLMKDWRG
jgi:hypothetical protein